MTITLRRTSTWALTAVVALSTVACQSGNDEVGPPATYSVSYRWDDTDPTVDLESPAISAIRATVESDDIELDIGRQYTYPGYVEAVGPNGTVPGGLWKEGPGQQIGTLNLKVVVKAISDTAIDAVVCRDETTFSRNVEGRYPLPSADRSGAMWALSVAARRTASTDHGVASTSPQPFPLREPAMAEMTGPPGRSPRPAESVFGDWHITEYRDDYSSETRALCFPWIEQRWGGPIPPAPTRSEAEPPAIEPFYPGW